MAVIEFTENAEEETAMRAEHVRTQVTNDLFLEGNPRMCEKGEQAE